MTHGPRHLHLVWSQPMLEPTPAPVVRLSMVPPPPPPPSLPRAPALLGRAKRREWEQAEEAYGRALERAQRSGIWDGEVEAAEARLRALAARDYTRSALRRLGVG